MIVHSAFITVCLLSYIGVEAATTKVGKCEILATSGVSSENITGTVHLYETEGSNILINVQLSGFNNTDGNTKHGFHVHATADLGNQCKSAGGHYNPMNKVHGGPTDANRHVGDLGNIMEAADGTVNVNLTDTVASMFGTYSIIGKPIVVHALEDDLGKGNKPDSNTTGAAGARIGCCLIELESTTSNAFITTSSIYLLLITLMVFTHKMFN